MLVRRKFRSRSVVGVVVVMAKLAYESIAVTTRRRCMFDAEESLAVTALHMAFLGAVWNFRTLVDGCLWIWKLAV
jgi:hypothetical protein